MLSPIASRSESLWPSYAAEVVVTAVVVAAAEVVVTAVVVAVAVVVQSWLAAVG